MSAHTIVVHFNKYCHQKPAGNYRLPEFSSSSLQSSCLLCNLGNTCLSTYCNVKEPPSKKKNKPMSSTVYSLVIPGLPDDSNSIPTVLTNPTFTKTKKIKVFPIFSTKSSIFHPPSKPKSTAKVSISTATQKAPKVRNKMTKKSETPSWYDKSLKRKLLGILLKTSLKSTKRRKQSSPNKNKNGSTTRKLETSEIMCPKLLSKNPSSSSSTADSSSGSTNISSSSNDSSFLSPSSSSNFNYTEIIDYLQTEWDTSKDLFDEENNPSLPSPEKLRMPSSTRKRKQSPSPERHVTPTKEPGSSTPRIRTPRKDTPKKKSQRLQCRNRGRGCCDYFANIHSRDKHESMYCKFRNVDTEVTMDSQFQVPSHLDLHLDPHQCRICQKIYCDEKSRIRHERDKHRFYQHLGRTVSPVSFPPRECNISPRPQSCPPPELSDACMTPQRPSIRRRTLSRSSLASSPIPCLDSSPVGSPLLSLTPTSSQDSSFIASENEYDENQNITTANQCSFCLIMFKNSKNHRKHHCNFRPDSKFLLDQNISPVVLSLPKELEKTLAILSHLCKEDVVQMCRFQNWCLPFYYPLCFPHHFRSGHLGIPPVLEKRTANKQSSELLKKMVEMHGKIELPKYIIIKDEETNTSAYLCSTVLTPTSEFNFMELSESFVVTSFTSSHPSKKNIEKEVLVCHMAPAPASDSDIHSSSHTGFDQGEDWDDFLDDEEESDEVGRQGNGCDDREDYGGDGCQDGGEDWGEDVEDGGDDDDGGDSGLDDGSESDVDGQDSDDNNLNENSYNLNSNNNLTQAHINLLPRDFQPGLDGLGACNRQQLHAASYFRHPWKFSDLDIQNLVRMFKQQFFDLVLTCVGAEHRSSSLNIFAQCFLMLYKLCHSSSFRQIATLFGLTSHNVAANVFYRQVTHQFLTNCNIPRVIVNGQVNQPEIDKLLDDAFNRTPTFYRVLVKDFLDPTDRDRTPLLLNTDGTYIDIQGSADLEQNKYMFYAPRSGHTAKWINFTDLAPKFVGVLPVASSQSPSSGDGLLLPKHIHLSKYHGPGVTLH